jgi:uncharacterized protein YjiS (DUF1127 family)
MAELFSIPGAIGAGLASIAAIAGGHGLPPPNGAFCGAMPASAAEAGTSKTAMQSVFEALRRWRRRPAIVPLHRLDDHTLRDIGLTRGMLIKTSAIGQHRRRPLVD